MKTFLRLLGFLRPFGGWVALSVLLGVATIASNIGLLGTSAYLIASAALHPSIAELQVAIVGVRFFGISRGVFRYLERLVSHSVNFRLLAGLRVWFYRKLEPLAPACLQDVHSGDLLGRSIGDVETLQDFYVRIVSPPVTALIVTIGMGLFVGAYNPFLALVLVGGLLLSGVGIPLFAASISRGPGRDLTLRRSDLGQELVDIVQGMPDLLVFDQQAHAIARFEAINERLAHAQLRIAWTGGLVGSLNLLAVNLTLLGMLMFGIPLVVGGALDGVILAVLSLVTLASFEAVSPLGQAAQQLPASLNAARRLFDLVSRPPAVPEPISSLPPPASLDLEIHDLTFRYAPDLEPALQSVNLSLPAGKRIGIIGPSGSGKSTLLNLILRFWDCDAGCIEINGQDIKNYSAATVRLRIATITQETYIFTASLRENLLIAKPLALDDDLLQALERAQLMDWYRSLPNGLDTWLGTRGALMSGGERQRLALARAVLQQADLYLLDEPTSSLDPDNAAKLVAMLEELTRGRSVLWVTHSVLGMDAMDEILVLRQGRVVERGRHADLIALAGDYARMAGTFTDKPAS